MANYPETIPFFSRRSGFASGAAGGILRTSMDAGPAKMRRRSTSAPRPYSGVTAPMSSADLAVFEDWVLNSIAGGSLSFHALHPVEQVQRRFRFTNTEQPYSISSEGHGFSVSAELEILS